MLVIFYGNITSNLFLQQPADSPQLAAALIGQGQ